MAPSSIEHLSVYLVHKALDSSPKISNSIPWKICFAIVGYALSLDNQDGPCQNGVMMDIIRHLEATSTEFAAAEQNSLEYLQKEKEIHDILVDTFIPQAQEYFNIPTSDITSLALFLFILLYSLPNPTPKHVPFKIYWVFPVIMKELKFQLEVLGDMKLHSDSDNHPGDGEDFLNEFQDVANAAGNFIYYCVFPSYPPLDITWFCVCSHVLFYKFHLLNENIKNHGAAQFSKFPDISGNPWSASTDILNSLSELKYLLALLEDLMNNSCFHFVLELNNQAKKLYGKLRSMQSFLKAVIADLPQQQKEIDGLKECVIPIRNVTAEAQFLITSFAKDQFPVWYMMLRLCNVITKFEIIGKAFLEIIEKVDEQVLVDCDPTEPSQDMQEKKIQTPTTRPSITHLSKYLTGRHSREQLTWLVTQQPDQSLPWKGLSCLAIVCYALKVSSDSKQDIALMDAIRGLNDIASEYEADHVQKERQIAEIFAKSFMPNAKNIFTLQMSSFPGSNVEHLAGFIHFLLQILNSEADHTQNKDLYIYLQKELTFLFAILGDVPFQHIELESVQTILKEFETAVNEAATFTFSCAFTTLPVSIPWFCVSMHVMIYKFHLLNENIKDHCIRFSKLPEVPVSPKNTTAAVDSLFIVESLLADLENMMDSSLHLIIGVKDQIEQLQEKLVSVQPFLMLHDREIEGVREHIIQIRDAAYEAEYLINSFVSEDVPTWYVTLRLPNIIPKFDVLVGVAELKKVDGIQVKEVLEDSIVMDDNIFMGYENEATQILGELTGGSDTLRTILILGMPGIGKTTLAKKLYDDGMVTHYFDECAWSVVSQTYQKRKALTDILMSLRSMLDKETVLKMEDDSLISSIYKILKGKRYLIVIDDVWNSDVWKDLRRYLPNDRTGSRILLTSRIRDVTPTNSIVHTLSLLSEDQCWELLEKKVFGEGQCPKQLVNSGKEIATKCNGLPLLVVIIAGVLANIEKENSVWKKVEKSLDSYMSDCMRILELSYEHLPDRLKLCFLYLGIFPEDTEIQVRKLTWLWIADGFIPKEEWKSPEDVANEYLNCLIDRSLVMVTRNKSTGGVKACSIHDLLRDMCLIKAREENFLILVKNESFSNYEKQQRLCVHSTDLAYLRPFSLHCRSFFGYLSDPSSCIPQMKHDRAM